LSDNLNGGRAKAAEEAARTLRRALAAREPEEHAKAIHREVEAHASLMLGRVKGAKPFTPAQMNFICELVGNSVHMASIVGRKQSWFGRLWNEFSDKTPMDQIKIGLAVIAFVSLLTGGISAAWFSAPAILRSVADFVDKPVATAERQVDDSNGSEATIAEASPVDDVGL
jgi:hypothetical protein